MRLAEPLGGKRLAPLADRIVGDLLISRPAGQLELVGADLLRLHLLRQALVGLHLLIGEEVERRSRHAVATGDVQVAADGAAKRQCVRCRGGGGAILVPRAAPLDAAGLVHGVHARSVADLVRLEPSDLARPLRRVLRHVAHELLEAIAPVRHEVHVVEALEDERVQDGHGERRIRAGTQRQPEVCLCRGLGVARVHHDDLEPRHLEVGVAVHAAERGSARVHAPEDQAACSTQIRLERRPASNAGLGHEGRNPAEQRVVEAVRRAELVQEATARPVIGARGAAC